MTNKKVIGLVVALLLGALGTLLLRNYVNGVEDRALADLDSSEVYVVATMIPAGTKGDEVSQLVRVELLPAMAQVEGGVTDLQEIADLVASTDLMPGEQLLRNRFVLPESYAVAGRDSRGLVPDGLQEVTVALTSERALGGELSPGERVGVAVSVVNNQAQGAPADGTTASTASQEQFTMLRFDHLLVSNVQVSELPPPDIQVDDGANKLAQPGTVLVTFAVDAEVASRLVYAAEFGSLWLTRQIDENLLGTSDLVTQQVLLDGRRESLGATFADEPAPELGADGTTNEEPAPEQPEPEEPNQPSEEEQ